jgi:MFS family permease
MYGEQVCVLKRSFSMNTSLGTTAPEGEMPKTARLQALQEPTQPQTLGWQLLYWIANATIGINIVFYTILLPAKIAAIMPINQTDTFILISALGAVASLLTNPLVGAFSDRTTSALGRRFPWLLVGIALFLVAILILASADTPLMLGIGSVSLQIAINVLLAALSAVIPDQVPLSQRATVSAFGGMAPLVGGLIGQILVGQVIRDTNMALLELGLISAVCLLAFSLVLREHQLPREAAAPFRLIDILRSLWLSPRKHPEFALVWVARCLIFLASTTVINYLFYYLQAERLFSLSTAATGVQQFFTIYVVSIILSSLVCGKLSDRMQRRKPFVIGASLTMAVGASLLAFIPLWPMVQVAAAVLGIGFGTYLSCDLALASQLLPAASNRGKDFGLMNMAIFLPMMLATGIASFTLGAFHSYTVLLTVITAGTVLAASLILPIKSVR